MLTRVVLAMAMAAAVAGQGAPDPGFHEALRAADIRLAGIGHRLATANAPLCDRRQPGLGLVVHALAQYGSGREAARVAFRFTTAVGIEGVVGGGPADRAGVRADAPLTAIDGTPVGGGGEGVADRDRALYLLESGGSDRVVALELGEGRKVVVRAVPACRARFELLLGRGLHAGADGRGVHLGERWFHEFTDDEIAVIVAHELAHIVLRHRDRLDAAGVNRGLLKELGRNGRLFRSTERDADELGVHLLANAGYDPFAAARFWRTRGSRIDRGVFRGRTHPSSRARAEALETVARTIATGARPSIPAALLATRNRPLS